MIYEEDLPFVSEDEVDGEEETTEAPEAPAEEETTEVSEEE